MSVCPCCGQDVDGRPDPSVLDSIRMSTQERMICNLLARHFGKWVSTENIISELYSHVLNGGPESPAHVISVIVCRLRQKEELRSAGFELESTQGYGMGSRRLVYAEVAEAHPADSEPVAA